MGLRLGDLQSHVSDRQWGDVTPGAIVKRDLGRYYTLLAEAKRSLYFSLSEAEALVLALRDFDAAAVRYLWAEIEKEYREHADDAEGQRHYLPIDFDPVPFLARLRSLSTCKNMALLDAVERYWVLVERKYPDELDQNLHWVDSDLLVEARLVSPDRKTHDEEARRNLAERDAEERRQGMLVARDRSRLGRLRTKTSDDDDERG